MTDWHNDFQARVNYAAMIISEGGRTSRRFDSTCEHNDGDAVAAALVRRVEARPDTRLARNLWRYMDKKTALDAARRLSGLDLTEAARQMRAGTFDYSALPA